MTASATNPVPVAFEEHDHEALLLALLDEVIYVVDVLGTVPANVVLEEAEDGSVVGFLDRLRCRRWRSTGLCRRACPSAS